MGLPSKNLAIIAQIAAASAKITATPEDYGFDADGAAALAAAVTAAQDASDDSATHKALKESKTQASNDALNALLDLYRPMANQARNNPDVTDEKLADLGESRRQAPSRVGAPDFAPEIAIEQVQIGTAKFRFIQPDTRSAKLPDSAIGYEVSLCDGTGAPVEGEADSGVKTFVSKSRVSINTQIGKAKVRAYARYVGKRAQFGPWSMPQVFSQPSA
jgi:hypothetical protein